MMQRADPQKMCLLVWSASIQSYFRQRRRRGRRCRGPRRCEFISGRLLFNDLNKWRGSSGPLGATGEPGREGRSVDLSESSHSQVNSALWAPNVNLSPLVELFIIQVHGPIGMINIAKHSPRLPFSSSSSSLPASTRL